MKEWTAALVVLAMLAGAGALAAQEASDPGDFVRGLYAGYQREDFNVFQDPPKVFSAELVAAIAENDRCTPEGEVGAVDFDPLCQCQDFAGMTAKVGRVRQTRAGRAQAEVELAWDEPERRVVPLRLELVSEAGAWKVADVQARGEASLSAYLRTENRRACAGKPR